MMDINNLPQTIFREYSKNEGLRSDRSAGDRSRHRTKVRQSIKDNIADIISDESIIGKSGDKIIKVPIKGIKEYRFVFGDNGGGAAQGDGNTQPGQVVGKTGQQPGQGNGKDKAGSEAGDDIFETEITLDELKEILFEDLQLPNLRKTSQRVILQKNRAKKDGYRRMGIQVRLDRFKTAKERVKRKKATQRHGELEVDCELCNGSGQIALIHLHSENPPEWMPADAYQYSECKECEGTGKVDKRFRFRREDRRFKHMDVKPKPQSNAAIIFVMDTSGCYSEDTEVLTSNGWKLFKDVDIDTDIFATRNSITKEFEWQHASNYIEYPYNGKLYNFYSKYIDVLVTPNHRMLIDKITNSRNPQERKEFIIEADKLSKLGIGTNSGNICIPMFSWWSGQEIVNKSFGEEELVKLQQVDNLIFELRQNGLTFAEIAKRVNLSLSTCHKIFNSIKNGTIRTKAQNNSNILKMSGDDYCAFMGMWLSEGSTRKCGSVVIAQDQKSTAFESFRLLLQKILGREPLYDGKQFDFCCKQFSSYLRSIAHKAKDKFIPDDIMNSTPRQIEIFWKYYWLGDSSKSNCEELSTISTTSKKITDQLLELAQKLGFQANYYTDNRDLRGRIIHSSNGKTYSQKTSNPCFKIVRYKSIRASFNCRTVAYTGNVFCVSVPNGTLYVRRNGKTAWCGNSMDTSKKFLARSFFNILYEFISAKYDRSEVVFISHHTEAQEVDEEAFFHKGESGGTFISSGLNKAIEIINARYNPSIWNSYLFQASDGDNFDSDNENAMKAVRELCDLCNMFGYVEIKPAEDGYYASTLIPPYTELSKEKDNLKIGLIKDKLELFPIIKDWLSISGE